LVDGKEKESRMNVCSSFEKMDGVRIMLGVWSPWELSQTLSGLVAQLTIGLATKFRIW
jgi:hypothetical protein